MHLLNRCRAGLAASRSAATRRRASSSAVAARAAGSQDRSSVRLAIVGDVHGDWDERRDGAALQALGDLDAVMFVGDYGEENLSMVSALAAPPWPPTTTPPPTPTPPPPPPRIVLLGNHDAWYSLTAKGRKRAAVRSALAEAGLPTSPKLERPQQRERRRAAESAAALEAEAAEERWAAAAASSNGGSSSDDGGDSSNNSAEKEAEEDPAVLGPGAWAQLQALGSAHAGFRHWGALPQPKEDDSSDANNTTTRPLVSVVGARPFSKGGASIADCARFYRAFYGLSTVEQSAARLAAAARDAPAGRSLVLLAHNGPSGMGAARHDPCGVDWLTNSNGGDHGDVDMRMALDALHEGRALVEGEEEGGERDGDGSCIGERRHVALVVHGHMHHRLRNGGNRRMVHVDAEKKTIVLNAATVPRVRWAASAADSEGGSESDGGAAAATLRHFLVVELSSSTDDQGLISADVERAEDVWVRVEEEIEGGMGQSVAEDEDDGRLGGKSSTTSSFPPAVVAERREVLRTARGEGDGGVLKLAWDAASGRWTQHVWRGRREEEDDGKEAAGNGSGEKQAAATAAAAARPR